MSQNNIIVRKMMKINIVSTDKRYMYLSQLLLSDGHDVKITTCDRVDDCDALILPLRQESSDSQLEDMLKRIDSNTLVVSGYSDKIKELFDGMVFDYSGSEMLLQGNAYLTAEATIPVVLENTEKSLDGMKLFVSGYGRIGKILCRLFSSLGAKVFAYARRDEVKGEILADGYSYAAIEYAPKCDVIINTAPAVIYSKQLIDEIPTSSTIIELASYPGGFENTERVVKATGLPGKLLPKSASKHIYDAIKPLFPNEKG